MILTYINSNFILKVRFEDRHIPKKAGFVWNVVFKKWETASFEIAKPFLPYADEIARNAFLSFESGLSLSRAIKASNGPYKAPDGLSYLPYQEAGIEYGLTKKRFLNADEAGTGKTIQVIGMLNQMSFPMKILILCPASLRLNWKREIEKWAIDKRWVSSLDVKELTPLTIVSYDSAWRSKYYATLRSQKFDVIVLDEAHNCKNEDTKRTKVALTLASKAEHVVFLTGTPILNRPLELWPILHNIDSKTWHDKYEFAFRYCGAYYQDIWVRIKNHRTGETRPQKKRILNMSGASNLAELQEKLRSTIMIRRLKEEVLPQLPKKRRQVIEIAPTKADAKTISVVATKWSGLCEQIGYEEALKQLEGAIKKEPKTDIEGNVIVHSFLEDMVKERQESALIKIPYAVEHIKNMLENVDKVVVFGHHKAVMAELVSQLKEFDPVMLVGGMSDREKQKSVDTFQNNPKTRVFLGNIKAAGVGVTLTASSTVIFIEIDPTPGIMSQAEDRCVRIGAIADFVLIQHLVLEGSLDKTLCEMVIKKQKIADKALDD